MGAASERMKRWRTSVDLAGERPVGENPYTALADGHSTHRPPTAEERAAQRERMLWQALDSEMREREYAEGVAARLCTELALYRPDRDAEPPAPDVAGHWLVEVANESRFGVHYAVDEQHPYPVAGAGFPDFHVPARKTLCGRKTGNIYALRWHGWPAAEHACAECRAALPAVEPAAQLSLLEGEAS